MSSTDTLDVKSRARLAYDLMGDPFPATDIWNSWTKRCIGAFVRAVVPAKVDLLFNAGCGGNEYGLADRGPCVNLDISLRQCLGLQRAVVGDIERIPFPTGHFDVTLCVGAVVNYVEAGKAIPELIRVTRPGGLVVVDFESSYSAEIMFSPQWAKPASVIERYYIDHMDKTYLYSPAYVRNLFERNGATIARQGRYHTTTAMWERIFTKALIPKAAYTLDGLASRLPGTRAFSSSVLLACRKAA
jgi:SAM-dependent methyltransferase